MVGYRRCALTALRKPNFRLLMDFLHTSVGAIGMDGILVVLFVILSVSLFIARDRSLADFAYGIRSNAPT